MKTAYKPALFLSLAFVAVFICSQKTAFAANLYSVTATSNANCAVSNTCYAPLQNVFATSTNFGATSTQAVGQVRVFLGLAGTASADEATGCWAVASIKDNFGVSFNSPTKIYWNQLPVGTERAFDFAFDASSTINFSSQTLKEIDISRSGTWHDCNSNPLIVALVYPSPDSNVSDPWGQGVYGNPFDHDWEFVMVITDQYSAPITLPPVLANCPDTSWAVGGVDFGKGACNVAYWLFIPPSGITDQFANVGNTLNTKIPISYVYEVQNDIRTSATSTASIPSIILQSASTSPFQMSFTLFGSSTLAQVADYPGMSILRGLAVVLIWVGFGMMCYYTGAALFNRK